MGAETTSAAAADTTRVRAPTLMVTGANGLLGTHLVRRAAMSGYRVLGAVTAPQDGAGYVPWALNPESGLPEAPPDELAALLMVAGPSFAEDMTVAGPRHIEAVRRLLAWARRWDVRRVLFVSALGADAESAFPLHQVKAEAEALVRQSGLDWTIVRPSMMFGKESDFFRRMEAWAQQIFALVPKTLGVAQPVYVGDVAEAILRLMVSPGMEGATYELPGPHPLGVYDIVKHVNGDASVWSPRWTIRVPEVWGESGVVQWPWTVAEWDYFGMEPYVRDVRWMSELGILPRPFSMFYGPHPHQL